MITRDGYSYTLTASMGLGGGYVPMIVMQRRFGRAIVNDTLVSPTLEAGAGEGGNNLPNVLTMREEKYNEQSMERRRYLADLDNKEC